MSRYKPPTIEEIGLEEFMKQNGYDYSEFKKRYDLKEPKAIIARALGVDRRTVDRWITAYEKELANHD